MKNFSFTAFASSSLGNCYLISDGETGILLDCGIRYKKLQKLIGFRVSKSVASCLVTHEHGDHSRGLNDLLRYGVDVFMSPGTAHALSLAGHHRVFCIQPLQQFRVQTWTIMPFETVHDCAEPFGYLLQSEHGEKALFATDTSYIKHRFRGLTRIIVECNYIPEILNKQVDPITYERTIATHFGLNNVLGFLKINDLSQVKSIHLIHMSSRNCSESLAKQTIQEATGIPVYVEKE